MRLETEYRLCLERVREGLQGLVEGDSDLQQPIYQEMARLLLDDIARTLEPPPLGVSVQDGITAREKLR